MPDTIPLPSVECPSPVLRPGAQGIARVVVDDTTAQLFVTYLASPLQAYLLDPLRYSLTGGGQIFPRIVSASSDPKGVRLQLDQIGDFSIYTLTVNGPDIDPFFASRKLRFRLACDDRFDCRPHAAPDLPPEEIAVSIDYLTKDYAGFRQALIDFIPTRIPAWTERNEADLGMVLLELFAAAADNLSYIQDRVASEAFLGTATQRRSVAGHLALIGYQMDEGAAAHTWLRFEVNAPQVIGGPQGFKVSTRPDGQGDAVVVFETMGELGLDPDHNRMALYDYGNQGCVLPPSATSAALSGHFDKLKECDFLLFDNGEGGRDVVRLTSSPRIIDSYTLVTWSAKTRLHHSYPTSTTQVSGNVLAATHGEIVDEQLTQVTGRGRRRAELSGGPLAFLDPETPGFVWQPSTSDFGAFSTRAARSVSTLSLQVNGDTWERRNTLLGARPTDRVYRIEVDDSGVVTLVFGDGTFGRRLPDDASIVASYRVGGGSTGNVGAGSLTEAHPDGPASWLVEVTNPLPATGGRDPETRDHARRIAPATFQKPLAAVTAADYENAAASYRDSSGKLVIQRAKASFRWTGSWLTVTLAIDPFGAQGVTPALRQGLLADLRSKRLAGYEIDIVDPAYLPLEVELEFTPDANTLAPAVRLQLILAMEAFFNPDNFSFGDGVQVSSLYAAAMAVRGVRNAKITRLAKFHVADPEKETSTNIGQGFLPVGRDQIVRLDNDRNFPQNGTLSIRIAGGFA